jgi:hypothetical protein
VQVEKKKSGKDFSPANLFLAESIRAHAHERIRARFMSLHAGHGSVCFLPEGETGTRMKRKGK